MAPHAPLSWGWTFKKAFQNLAVGAVCLATLAGQVSPAAAQMATMVNPPPGVALTANGPHNTPTRVVVSGIADSAPMVASTTTNRFSTSVRFQPAVDDDQSAVERAYIRTEAEPLKDGTRIHVKSFHRWKDDNVTLWLLAEVFDKESNQLRTVVLATLAEHELLNPGSFRGHVSYDLMYEDVNRFLQARNPNLRLVPGETSLAVAARWTRSGHEAGGFGRGGVFRLPGTASVVSTTGTKSVGGANNNTPLPLDMQVAFPQKLIEQIPQLAPDGQMLSRLESELKGTSSKADMTAATRRMYDVWMAAQAGDTKKVEALLGRGWKIETSSKFWVKDDGGTQQPGRAGTGMFAGYRVNDDGLPMIEPMVDVYLDDPALGMTRLGGALRLRSNSAGVSINIKPGAGRAGEKLNELLPVILQRIEWGFQMSPGTTPELAADALRQLDSPEWGSTVFNLAQREITGLGSELILSDALDPWLEVSQQRHKFVLTNPEGVSVEFSFDTVKAKTTRPEHNNPDGTPREVEFHVLETELDHLATTGSSNQSGAAMSGSSVNTASFLKNDAQDAWLRATSAEVTMSIDPRLHEIKDLEDPGFRSTSSYAAFQEQIKRVVPSLFPRGLTQGVQKAVSAAVGFGVVISDEARFLPAFERAFNELGYQWTPQLAAKFEATRKDPVRRALGEKALAGRARAGMDTFLEAMGRSVGEVLPVSVPQMQTRLRRHLRDHGFHGSPEVDALVKGVARRGLTVSELEKLFSVDRDSSGDVIGPWMAAAGAGSPPTLTADVNLLLGENTRYGRLLRKQLSRAGVDAGSVAGVEAFLRKATATGRVKMADVRRSIDSLRNHPEHVLDQLASLAQLPESDQPILRVSTEYLLPLAKERMVAGFLEMNDGWVQFLDLVAKSMSPAEANAWLSSGSRFYAGMKRYAEQLGVQTPRLDVNVGHLDRVAGSMLSSNHVVLSPEIREFLRKAIEAGADGELLINALWELESSESLEEAFARHGVDVPPLPVPKIEYDKSSLAAAIKTGWSRHASVISSGAKLDKFIDDCLATGLTASQSARWGRAGVFSAPEVVRTIPAAVRKALPRLPFDVAKIVDEWKTRFAAEWTAATETSLTEALKQAFQNDAFHLSMVRAPTELSSPHGHTLPGLVRTLRWYSKPTPSSNAWGH